MVAVADLSLQGPNYEHHKSQNKCDKDLIKIVCISLLNLGGHFAFNSQIIHVYSEIKARFRGKSHTCWYDPARKVSFKQSEYYLDNTEVLWSKGKNLLLLPAIVTT